MNVREFIEKKKKMQEYLLEFIEREDEEEENFLNFQDFCDYQNVTMNKHEMKALLYLIIKIADNHHRTNNFFAKIEQILIKIKEAIMKFFSNSEIFKIFKSNKRLLLFLIEEKMITIDENIHSDMMQNKMAENYYSEYFSLEIKQMEEEEEINEFSKEEIEIFKEKRKMGENDDEVCEMIRKDLIEEFITYVKKTNSSIKKFIKPSIFETNSFLLKNQNVTLIEYAAFFGSIQIFRYLYKNGCKLTESLWLYAIHGDDAEIISILEENEIQPPDDSFDECIKESIKCHHNHIVNYFLNNYMNGNHEKIDFKQNFNDNIASYFFHYYNFSYFPNECFLNKNVFYVFCYACKYDYYPIVKCLIEANRIDVNEKIIQTLIFLYNSNIIICNEILI
ncbi:hypothetical protein M9Y10_022444 [Tritrichomonas musculus]|uniref:DUF3447 domain-containing protein n=1 Tax=Tritrichomonas musculus TaxID=1915356 RepID=A0ABR2KSV6_9EUKA